VLDGVADVTLGESTERLSAGEFVYYSPLGPPHAIRNAGDGPLSYWMLNWRGAGSGADEPLASQAFRYSRDADPERGFQARTILKHAPTVGLRKFHAHISTLQPGAGYGEHVDEYDVAHVVLTGRLATMGVEAGPWSLLYFASGEGHDMRCVSAEPAQYLVFELHGGVA
jgi:mannose-6-phosphate isomerase-like protein (cupin superfamily)